MNMLFYTSAVIAVISALLVITNTNIMRAVMSLLVLILAVSSIFYTLGAPFVAVLQIIVYAGAILVLFVFVVMILNQGKEAQILERKWIISGLGILPLLLTAILLVEFALTLASPVAVSGSTVLPKAVGISLFTDYAVGVELASVLLLAALVAAFHFGRMPKPSEKDDE